MGTAPAPLLDPRLEHLYTVHRTELRSRGRLGSRGAMPMEKVVGGELLRVVDRPFTRRLTHVQVLLEFATDCGRLPGLRPQIRINFPHGRIRTGYLPVQYLPELTEMEGIRRVAPSLRVFPRMERAVEAVGAPGLEALRERARGEVLVGLVDSGIDPGHPDFRDRILRIWDQTEHGEGVDGAGYGVEHATPDAMERCRDESGHGTHLAGIAAGAAGSVNPRAKLVVVKTGFTEGEVLDGIRYIREVARELSLPAVVNLSLGGHGGPHDGTGVFSAALDELAGPGLILCAAAGNEGREPIHLHRRLAPGEERQAAFLLREAEAGAEPEAHLYGWATVSPGDHVEVSVEAPEGDGVPERTPFHEPLLGRHNLKVQLLRGCFVRIAMCPIQEDGDQPFLVDVAPGLGGVHRGPWTLRLRHAGDGEAEVHLWSGEHPAGPAAWLMGEGVSPEMKIGEPGDARGAITVGAWTTRLEWESLAGLQELPGTLGGVAPFSSPGPLRRPGRAKPDLVAPGEWIVSSRSALAPEPPSRAVGSRQVVYRGSSQATAFVSGWVSLLLAENPDLGPEEILALLRESCERPEDGPAELWGAGRLILREPGPEA